MSTQSDFDKQLLRIAHAIEGVLDKRTPLTVEDNGRLRDVLRSIHAMQQDSRDGFLVVQQVSKAS